MSRAPNSFYGWHVVGAAFTAQFVSSFCTLAGIGPFFTVIEEEFSTDASTISNAVGASILLDGREKGWFKEYDPGNSFCLHDSVRSLVPDIWVRRDNGWAFADSKLEDGVEFNENEYLDIKREYIRDYGSHFDQIDGVGKFGGATE